jgi:hypothetical protein
MLGVNLPTGTSRRWSAKLQDRTDFCGCFYRQIRTNSGSQICTHKSLTSVAIPVEVGRKHPLTCCVEAVNYLRFSRFLPVIRREPIPPQTTHRCRHRLPRWSILVETLASQWLYLPGLQRLNCGLGNQCDCSLRSILRLFQPFDLSTVYRSTAVYCIESDLDLKLLARSARSNACFTARELARIRTHQELVAP